MATENVPGDESRLGVNDKSAGKKCPSKNARQWPEDNNDDFWWPYRIYRLLTYSYLSPLFAKGVRQHKDGTRLGNEDLFEVPEMMRSARLSRQFRELYVSSKSKHKLVATLWLMIKDIYIPAGCWNFITVVCQSANPLIVRELLRVLEEHPSERVVKEGLPFAVGIFLVMFVNGIANHRHRQLAMKSGVLMRNALVNVIYEHVLHMTPRGRVGLTSGETSTLVAVDTQKIFEAAQEGHMIWSLPLSISLVTLFLILVMGPVTLVGIAVLVCFLPIASFVTARMLSIRQQRVKKTDNRIGLSTAMLQGIKVTKLNNYEDEFSKKVSDCRNAELKLLRKEMAVWSSTLTITVISPLLATVSTFAVYTLTNESHILTASKTFSVLLLFSALRFPINYAARFLGKAAQALSALERVAAYLKRESDYSDDASDTSTSEESSDPALVLEKAAFHQGHGVSHDGTEVPESSVAPITFRVSEFNLELNKGEVMAVCGPVGAGKSTLIGGIIDEVSPATKETTVKLGGKVAYVPQTPFILNTTFRENILFGLPFDREKYERVIDSCCLRADVDQLGAALDLTQIGERGVTLSGGQKQRVSLARAAYSSPDVVLCDDPLSALDANTSRIVFDRLMKGKNALFKSSAVLLVTHSSHLLNMVDRILVIVDGHNKFLGSWRELGVFHPSDEKTRIAVDHIRSSVQEDAKYDEDSSDLNNGKTDEGGSKKMHEIMMIEQREYGLSNLKTWLLWYKYAGGTYFLSIIFLLLAFDRTLYVAVEYWIARWTSGAEGPVNIFGHTFAPQTDGFSAQYDYLKVLAVLVVISVVATYLRSTWAVSGGSRAATKVFTAMLESVLQAPLYYFETTPMGRVLNRFTYDIEVVDIVLTEAMSILLIASSWFVAGVVVMSTILPWMLLCLVPVTGVYMVILLHYRRTGVDLQRLDALSRSPVQAMVSEVLDGASSIRVFKRKKIFISRFRDAADVNGAALLNFVTGQRWLGVRIESLGASVVLVASTLVVSLNDLFRIDPGLVGLLIVWSSNFTITLGFLIDFFGETESAITAIERVDAMTKIPKEKPMKTEEGLVPAPAWPEHGHLVFQNVCLRYRPGLPLALKNLTFSVPPGKSCGVVGRTGAGKSSLTVALFRLVEIESGQIILDGRDLSELGLSDVRGRANGMAIIPQDPFLTGSTLRECIDPFGRSSDNEVMDALRSVRMVKSSDSVDTLSTAVEEGGSNYSIGERQLLNLARALLSKPTVLVLDEATASVDGETDAFIQQMLRTRFERTTLLTIAHRLHTIMDYDLVLVMADGQAAEMGSPKALLQTQGMFADLVDATGPESARALRQMVKSTAPAGTKLV
ncbi:hypothetical protein ACA910_010731 [Epithemia clementina (nom. ined.)]